VKEKPTQRNPVTLLIQVPCTECGETTVPIPANATQLATYITCADCAAKNHTINHEEIRLAQTAKRQQAIEKAWADRTPAFFRTHNLIDDPNIMKRINTASKANAPLIVYGQNAQKRSAILWQYLTALGTAGIPSPRIGGGQESDTLALATTADFKLIDNIKRDYLNPKYRNIYIDGIGEARFLNKARRHEEYSLLARTMLNHNQTPILTVNFWSPANPNGNPFKSPEIIDWVGVNAAADLATIYDRKQYLPIEVT
jgi:hypothetical protein